MTALDLTYLDLDRLTEALARYADTIREDYGLGALEADDREAADRWREEWHAVLELRERVNLAKRGRLVQAPVTSADFEPHAHR